MPRLERRSLSSANGLSSLTVAHFADNHPPREASSDSHGLSARRACFFAAASTFLRVFAGTTPPFVRASSL